MESWHDFDVSYVAECTHAPLQVVSLAAFERLGLLKSFRICTHELVQFLQLIEALYPRCDRALSHNLFTSLMTFPRIRLGTWKP